MINIDLEADLESLIDERDQALLWTETPEAPGALRSGEFAANPIGAVFDPQELVARYAAGEPVEQLTARPPLPAGISPFEMLRF